MPELPEVEGGRQTLEKVVGSQITSVQLSEPFDELVFTGLQRDILEKTLLGCRLKDPRRKGKQLYITVEQNGKQSKQENHSLLIHFGMTGCLVLKGVSAMQYKAFKVDESNWPPRFWKLVITTANGLQLAYCDQRRIGRIKIQSNPLLCPPLSLLAPDPLVDGVPPPDVLYDKTAKISSVIKSVLLDQSVIVCGLGNWMVDEILYHAKIHPETKTGDLNIKGLESLKKSIEYVVKEAVNAISRGEDYPLHWLFHKHWDQGKKGASTVTSQGEKINVTKIGGRTTLFVPSVQLLSGPFVEKKKNTKLECEEQGVQTKKKRKIDENAENEEGTKEGKEEGKVQNKVAKKKEIKEKIKEKIKEESSNVESDSLETKVRKTKLPLSKKTKTKKQKV